MNLTLGQNKCFKQKHEFENHTEGAHNNTHPHYLTIDKSNALLFSAQHRKDDFGGGGLQ